MDCVFNKCIPSSTKKKFILKPTSNITHIHQFTGKTFVTGLAPSYETKFFPELKKYISESEYVFTLDQLMENFSSMWPCCFCFTYGYVFCLCTFGLSFCIPYCCISEAKAELDRSIKHANENVFNRNKLNLSYHSKCSTSWLQIEVMEGSELLGENEREMRECKSEENRLQVGYNQL